MKDNLFRYVLDLDGRRARQGRIDGAASLELFAQLLRLLCRRPGELHLDAEGRLHSGKFGCPWRIKKQVNILIDED